MALPGILAGTILTFILAMNAYATPFLLGGPLFKMMAPLVYNQFTQQAELAVRRRHRLHPDDGDAQPDAAANLIFQRRARLEGFPAS